MNKWRSPTAELVFRNKGYNTSSAGTSRHAKKHISVSDIRWADMIVVMEPKHKNIISAKYSKLVEYKNIQVLNILDNFQFMDSDLIEILNKTELTT